MVGSHSVCAWLALVSTLTLALVGCGNTSPEPSRGPERQAVSTSHAIYPTVAEAARNSDVVVVGSVAHVRARAEVGGRFESDRVITGPDGQPTPSLKDPMVFYDFSVERVLKGTVEDESLILGWPDLEKVDMEGMAPIGDGRVVLFLGRVDSDLWPDTSFLGADHFMTVTGSDNGVMDVTGDRVTARSPDLRSLTQQDAAVNSEGPLVTTVDAMAEAIG